MTTMKQLKESVEKQTVYLSGVLTVINTVKGMAVKAPAENISVFLIDQLLNFHAQYISLQAKLKETEVELKEVEKKVAKKKPAEIEKLIPKNKKDDNEHKT